MTRVPVFAYTPEQHERFQLGFRPTLDGDVLRVQVTSTMGCVRLNKTNVDPLKIHVRDALTAGAKHFVLNLRDCLDVDGYAMGVLLSMRNAFERAGGDCVVEDADAEIRALFVAYEIADRFTFATSEGTP
jgi:anti-anti-sigma regulatory factor